MISRNIREMVKRHEGLRLKPYRCPAGKMTIGYGWNLDAHKLPNDVASCLRVCGAITEGVADRLLTISLDAAEADCRSIFPQFDNFTEGRQGALVDMCFNLGSGGLLKFKKMRAAIEKGDWGEAARQVQDSAYWRELGGDPAGTDDGKLERPEEIARMLKEG